MSRSKDIFERLVRRTVRDVLFSDTSDHQHPPTSGCIAVVGSSSTNEQVCTIETTADVHSNTLLFQLINRDERPAEDEDNNGDEVNRAAWMKDCMTWSIDRLKTEKATLKQYLQLQRLKVDGGCRKMTPDMLILHEAYALLKLFVLERDPDYRHCLQQSIGSSSVFLTSLHVQLTLYATYFERSHGRQISGEADVEPIQTLYEFFVAHH